MRKYKTIIKINYNQTSTGVETVRLTGLPLFIKGSLGLVLTELAWECSLSLGSVSLSKLREL